MCHIFQMLVSCCLMVNLMLVFELTAGFHLEKHGKTTRTVSFPLMRSRRAAIGKDDSSSENLKGRPGQGYYIAIELGTPPQRVIIKKIAFDVRYL